MDIGKVKLDIKNGTFDDFYIFAGEEIEVLTRYIHKIAEVGKYTVEYIDSIASVYQKIRMNALLSVPTLYVVFDDMDFQKDEKAWEKLGKFKNNLVIFQYSIVDKRLKFWKFFQNRAVFFDPLNEDILTKYIKKEMPDFSEKHCAKLIEVCEKDYGRILLEIDKIRRYIKCEYAQVRSAENQAFETLLENGTIYQPPQDAIFDLVAAVMDRKPKKAYRLLEDCEGVGEAHLTIISVLYDNFRNLLQVQTCNSSTISQSTGLTPFQIKLVQDYVGRYTDDELIDIVKLLRELERGIKTGLISDEIVVQYAMVKIL